MATLVRTSTRQAMLIRAQLSLEQYAVFEWCANNLGVGELDDKETIIKLLEPHLQKYRQANPEPVNKPKPNPLTVQAQMPDLMAHKRVEYNNLVNSINHDIIAHREGRLTDEGLKTLLEDKKRLQEMKEELGIV